MKTFPWKKILLVLGLGVTGYVLYSIYQAFKAGERTLLGLLSAPFSGLSDVFGAVKGLFGGVPSASAALDSNSTPAAVVTSLGVDANSPLGQLMQTTANQLSGVNDTGQQPVTTSPLFSGPTLPWLQSGL
jgi:hypothetical protein